MGVKKKSLVVSSLVFIGAFIAFTSWHFFSDGVIPPITEGIVYAVYAGILDFIILFVATNILFRIWGIK